MPISANTLFHFTKDFETLLSILKSKFFPRLRLEQQLMPQLPRLAVPMVCFCDIPLSHISEHTSKYGRYAIGIRKDWAMGQGVSPVLYVHDHSLIPHTILSEIIRLSNEYKAGNSSVAPKMMRYLDTVCMMKRYEAFDERLNAIVRYYDEREWRYVPPRETDDQLCYLLEEFYQKEELRNKVNAVNENYGVVFNPDVINYIIVDTDQEVMRLKHNIEQIKEGFSYKSVQLLTTRILSMERIEEDM